MFCWEARAAMNRTEAGWIAGGEVRRLQSHLERCASCQQERARRERLVSLVGEAGRLEPPLAPEGFELAVLRAARARRREAAPSRPVPARLTPLTALSAMVLVVAAAALALLGGPPSGGPPTAFMADSQRDDRLASPDEIPFVVLEDLVGERRGRIPVTTYVMEPPPAQPAAVVRASL